MDRLCKGCASPVPLTTRRGRPREWCSDACRVTQYRSPGPDKRTCVTCGSGLPKGRHRYCQVSCKPKRLYPERACGVCGTTFRPATAEAVTCSRSCRQFLRNRREGKSSTRVCEVCGEAYRRTYMEQRTCGRSCGVELRRREGTLLVGTAVRRNWPVSRVYFRDCRHCGVLFTTPSPWATTCSDVCAVEARLESNRAYNRLRNPDRACSCGSPLEPGRRCCDECMTQSRRARRRRDKQRRRALKLGVISEPYTLAEIAKRDRFRCGLCRRKVNMKLVVPHPKAPTIDHVLPFACRGDDTRANVQLAHFACNCIKSDGGGGEQLALLG